MKVNEEVPGLEEEPWSPGVCKGVNQNIWI